MLKLEEDLLPRPLQAPLPIPRAVSGLIGVTHAIQKNPVHVSLFKGYWTLSERKDVGSRLVDHSYHRYLVGGMSATDVRQGGSEESEDEPDTPL
jgi:hypothetical protein